MKNLNGTEFHPAASTLTLTVAILGASFLVAHLAQEMAKRNERGRA